MDEELQFSALEASISDPDDKVEVTLHTDAVSVGITDPLFGTGKRIKWTAELLKKHVASLKNMPITAKILEAVEEGGKNTLVPHSDVVIGNITDAIYDEGSQKITTDGILWNHYFPETIGQLQKMYDDGEAEVSWEFIPTKLEASPDDGENVWLPLEGRFTGQAIVSHGADKGNAIRLLASVMEKEDRSNKSDMRFARPGSFEHIGQQVAAHLTANSDVDNYTPKTVLETFTDRAIYVDNGKYWELPYTIEGSTLKFSDTIEVEPTFQPLGASAAGSQDNPEGNTPTTPVKEAEKPVDEKELAALKASAEKVPTLETEIAELKKKVEEGEAAKTELATLKAANAEKEEEAKKDTLAASRLEEIEKIKPYADDEASQKKEDLAAFRTMDDAAFEVIKRVLTASAENKGGVAPEGQNQSPETSRQDPDGKADEILKSKDFENLLASVSGKEDK